ncbi:MAG: thermonuclease family protein [Hyphomicrobiaceae bacterium]
MSAVVSFRAGLAGTMILASAIAPASTALAQAAATLACRLEAGPSRAVAAVIDGDTFRLDDGVEVRLVGTLAPRPGDSGGEMPRHSWAPAEAARAGLTALIAGRSVALAFAEARTDRYGRVLAHVFTKDEQGGDVWVQGRLVETGMTRAMALPDMAACIGELVSREKQARVANLGLWSHAAYQVRPADRPTELARYRHSYQLVRGVVERVRQTRGLAIVELASGERPPAPEGRGQRHAFKIIWKRRIAETAGLVDINSLTGRNVLVRGWVDVMHGPEIEILTAGQLERED